jgi:carbon storage regulator CsrA
MLVLARRLHEKIIMPTLEMTVQVVALQGNMVRLGIEAPRDVPIFREEVYDPALLPPPAVTRPAPPAVGPNVRNRLNTLGVSIALLQRQLPAANLNLDAQKTLEQLTAHVAALQDQVQALLNEKTDRNRQAQLTS